MAITYPLDLSGVSPTNLVKNELHSVNEAKFRDYFFLVPYFSPFFTDNFSATVTVNGVTRQLVEDVDFSFVLSYVTGTRVTGKAMYGGVSLHNLEMSGIVTINYQTVGGDQIANRLDVLTTLADKAYNPRTTIWDILTTTPNAFPPTPHFQDYDNFYGQEEVVIALNRIRDAIIANSSLTQEEIRVFMRNTTGALLTDFVRKTGDVMTGPLTMSSDPIQALEVATKGYVDRNRVTSADLVGLLSNFHSAGYVDQQLTTKVNKSGDTMTGFLTLHSNPTVNLHATTKQYVDNKDNDLQLQINDVRNLANIANTDRATRAYVDDKFNQLMAYLIYALGPRK